MPRLSEHLFLNHKVSPVEIAHAYFKCAPPTSLLPPLPFLPFPFPFPPCSSSSCFFFTTNLPCSSPYLPRASSMLSTRPCKVNPPAATPQERGRGHFQVKCAGQLLWATEATLARIGELHSEQRLRMPVETNLPSVLLSSLGILPQSIAVLGVQELMERGPLADQFSVNVTRGREEGASLEELLP